MSPRRDLRRTAAPAAALAALVAGLLAGCAPSVDAEPDADGRLTTVLDMDAVVDIPYAEHEGTSVHLDLYLPEGDGPHPIVVMLHGGGFVSGDRATGGMQRIAQQLVGLGYAAASIDYSLAPDATYPTQVDETAAAVAFLREAAHAERWGLDPDRVALFGTSAGATIALRAGVEPAEETGVDAVVSLSGASVLDAGALELGATGDDQVRAGLAYLGCTAVATCEAGTAASPALNVTAASSPMMLVNGVGETIPQQHAERMVQALQDAGVPVELRIVDKPAHAAELLSPSLWADIADFLSARIGEEPPS